MEAIDETVPTARDRKQKKLAAAEASNANKRQRLGEEAYLQEKRDAAKVYRRRLKEKAAAAANMEVPSAEETDGGMDGMGFGAMPLPTAFAMPLPAVPIDVAGQLERLATLFANGKLSDGEFAAAKAAVLAPFKASQLPPRSLSRSSSRSEPPPISISSTSPQPISTLSSASWRAR